MVIKKQNRVPLASSIIRRLSSIVYRPAFSIPASPRANRRHPVSGKGFSLIEVAIAIVILGLVGGAVVSVFTAGAKAARKTQQQAVAYNLARAVLEQYSDWTSLDGLDGTTNGTVTNNTYVRPAVTLNTIIYTPTLTITDGPISPTQLKLLNATIDWIDGSSARNISVSTLKANY